MSSDPSRRRFAQLAGATAIAAIAGCSATSGGSESSGDTNTGTETASATESDTPTATETETATATETDAATATETEESTRPHAEDGHTHTSEPDHDHESDHFHGSMEVRIDGETTEFESMDRYLEKNEGGDTFHLHEDSDRWHAHQADLTLAEAADQLPDFDVSANSLTFEGETYEESSADTERVAPMVNGEEVVPSDYQLEPHDEVAIVVETAA